MSEAKTEGTIEVSLQNEPESLTDFQCRVRVAPSATEIKVPYDGGYEHLVRAESRPPGDGRVAFRWSGRTYVAE